MREKNLVILCIVFAILLSLIFFKKSIKPQVPNSEEITNIIESPITADELTEIILRLGSDDIDTKGSEDSPKRVHMVKEDDHWIIKTNLGVYARDQLIVSALEKLDQLEGELRSDRKGILGDYGIKDEQGIHVELYRQDGEMMHIIVGTQKAGYQNNFVRRAGSDAVYFVNENLLSALGVRQEGEDRYLNADMWADKRIAHLDVSEVTAISITQDDGISKKQVIDLKRELIDDKKQWQSVIPYDFGLSAAKIKKVIENFNNTYAQKVIAPDVEGVFDAPGWEGIFTLSNGGQVKIVRGSKDDEEKNYYLKQEGAGYVYLIAASTFNSCINRQGGIFASNPLKVGDDSISEFTIEALEDKKEFHAVKKASFETDEEAETEETGEEDKQDGLWRAANGDAIETKKIQDIIGKIKAISLEAILPPAASVKDAVIIRLVKEGESREYRISSNVKSDTGKECHYFTVSGNTQNYCASKSSITALLSSLP